MKVKSKSIIAVSLMVPCLVSAARAEPQALRVNTAFKADLAFVYKTLHEQELAAAAEADKGTLDDAKCKMLSDKFEAIIHKRVPKERAKLLFTTKARIVNWAMMFGFDMADQKMTAETNDAIGKVVDANNKKNLNYVATLKLEADDHDAKASRLEKFSATLADDNPIRADIISEVKQHRGQAERKRTVAADLEASANLRISKGTGPDKKFQSKVDNDAMADLEFEDNVKLAKSLAPIAMKALFADKDMDSLVTQALSPEVADFEKKFEAVRNAAKTKCDGPKLAR